MQLEVCVQNDVPNVQKDVSEFINKIESSQDGKSIATAFFSILVLKLF